MLVVDDTELSWGDAMYPVFRMYDKFVISGPFQSGWMILWRMADLKGHIRKRPSFCEEMEVTHREILLIGRLRIVTMRNVKNIHAHILLHHEPGTTPKSHAFTLTDCMEPKALMFADISSTSK